jgi:hypothetical protein
MLMMVLFGHSIFKKVREKTGWLGLSVSFATCTLDVPYKCYVDYFSDSKFDPY